MKNLFLVFMLLSSAIVFAEKRIVLLTHDQAPLTYLDKENKLDGIATKPVIHALEKMGWSYEFLVVPWARAQKMVETGIHDGFFAATQNSARDGFAVKSLPISDQTVNWYLLENNILDPSSPDFKRVARVGGYVGSNMLLWLEENKFNLAGRPVDPNNLFDMLLAGRLDACLANDYNFDNYLKKNPYAANDFRSVLQQKNPLYVYFSKKFIETYPEFLAEFNRQISGYKAGKR